MGKVPVGEFGISVAKQPLLVIEQTLSKNLLKRIKFNAPRKYVFRQVTLFDGNKTKDLHPHRK